MSGPKVSAKPALERRLEMAPAIESGYLDELRSKFERSTSGDAKVSILFRAIRFCCNQLIVLPGWVADEFFRATNDWFSGKAGTIDRAFGARSLSDKRARELRQEYTRALQIAN